MPNNNRQEIIRFHSQALNDLDRFIENTRLIMNIFAEANEQFKGRYTIYLKALEGFVVIIVKIQDQWEKLRTQL